jgi:hypothetical protein
MPKIKISLFQWVLLGICLLAILVDYLPKHLKESREVVEVRSFCIDIQAQNRHIHFIHKEVVQP